MSTPTRSFWGTVQCPPPVMERIIPPPTVPPPTVPPPTVAVAVPVASPESAVEVRGSTEVRPAPADSVSPSAWTPPSNTDVTKFVIGAACAHARGAPRVSPRLSPPAAAAAAANSARPMRLSPGLRPRQPAPVHVSDPPHARWEPPASAPVDDDEGADAAMERQATLPPLSGAVRGAAVVAARAPGGGTDTDSDGVSVVSSSDLSSPLGAARDGPGSVQSATDGAADGCRKRARGADNASAINAFEAARRAQGRAQRDGAGWRQGSRAGKRGRAPSDEEEMEHLQCLFRGFAVAAAARDAVRGAASTGNSPLQAGTAGGGEGAEPQPGAAMDSPAGSTLSDARPRSESFARSGSFSAAASAAASAGPPAATAGLSLTLRDVSRHRDPFDPAVVRLKQPLLLSGQHRQSAPSLAAAAVAGPITPETIRAAVTERFRRWAAAGVAATSTAQGGMSAAAGADAAADVQVLEGPGLLALAASFGFPVRRDPGFLVLCFAVMRHADASTAWAPPPGPGGERWATRGSSGSIPRSVAFFDAASADPGSGTGGAQVGLGMRLPLDAWVAAHINLSAMDERALVASEWARLQADLRAACGYLGPTVASPPPMSLIAVCRSGLARGGLAPASLVAHSALPAAHDAAASQRAGPNVASAGGGSGGFARGTNGFWSTAAATAPASALGAAAASRQGESYAAFHRFLFFSQLSQYNMGWLTVRRHYEMKLAATTDAGATTGGVPASGADTTHRHDGADGGPSAPSGVHAALGALGERFRDAAARAAAGGEVKLTRSQTVSLLHLFFARVSLRILWPGVAPAALRRHATPDWEERLLQDLCGFDPTSCIFGIPRARPPPPTATEDGGSDRVGGANAAADLNVNGSAGGGSSEGLARVARRLTPEQLRSLPMLLPTVTTLTSLWVRTVLLMTLGHCFPFLTMQFVHFLDQGGGSSSTFDGDTAAAYSAHMRVASGATLSGRVPWAAPPPMSFDQWQSLLRAFTEAERIVAVADRQTGSVSGARDSYAAFTAAMAANQAASGAADDAAAGVAADPGAESELQQQPASPSDYASAPAFGAGGATKSRAAFWSAGERRRALALVRVVVPQLAPPDGTVSPGGHAHSGGGSFTCAAGYAYGALEDTSYWPLLLDRFAAWLMEAMTPTDVAAPA